MNKDNEYALDPILAEVRRNREALSARFVHDLKKLMQFLNEETRHSDRKVVSLPPRRPIQTPPAA